MLISNSYLSDAKRVSVLASAASESEVENVATATNEKFLKSILYSSVAFIIRQCEGRTDYEESSFMMNLGTTIIGRMNGRFTGIKKRPETNMK